MRTFISVKSGGELLNSFLKMFTLSFSFSLLLSCFLILQFAGCSDSKSDKKEAPNFIKYSDENDEYILTISKVDTVSAKAVGYVNEDNDFYKLEYNDTVAGTIFVISSGQISISGDKITFIPSSTIASQFFGTLRAGVLVFVTGSGAGTPTNITGNDGQLYDIPNLVQKDGRLLVEGYTAATVTSAAYIYYPMPKQYDYFCNNVSTDDDDVINSLFAAVKDKVEQVLGQSVRNNPVTGFSITYFITAAKAKKFTPATAGTINESWDARRLYSYFFSASSDGYNWRDNGTLSQGIDGYIPDLSWEKELETCYLTLIKNNSATNLFVTNPTSLSINCINKRLENDGVTPRNNFRNGKYSEHFFALRTINVQIGDTVEADTDSTGLRNNHSNLVRIQTGATKERAHPIRADYQYNVKYIEEEDLNGVQAINVFYNFITNYVTANISDLQSRKFFAVGLDGTKSAQCDIDEIKYVWFIPSKEIIVVESSSGSLTTVVKYPVTIVITGSNAIPGNAGESGAQATPGNTFDATLTPPAFATPYR